MKHHKNYFKIRSWEKYSLSLLQDILLEVLIEKEKKTRKEKYIMIENTVSPYLYTHVWLYNTYAKKQCKTIQGFYKRMLNWKFRMSCKYNKYQTPKRVINKSIGNFQRKRSKLFISYLLISLTMACLLKRVERESWVDRELLRACLGESWWHTCISLAH